MIPRRRFLFACILAAATASTHVASAQTLAPERSLDGGQSAHGVTRVSVMGGRGNILVEGADTDRISWRVTLTPDRARQTTSHVVRDWFFRSAYETDADLIAATQERVEIVDGEMRLGLQPPPSARQDRIREEWVITVPRTLATQIELQVGNVSVRELSGSIRANVNTGGVTLAAPAGDINVTLNVGNVEIDFGSDSLRTVQLSSRVGSIDYSNGGLHTSSQRRHGPGDSLTINGSGENTIRANVNVGDIDLSIP